MSIESTILDALKADSTLAALLSTYASAPAIFTDVAPEDSETPHLICRFTQLQNSPELGVFNLYIDYFDYDKSRSAARDAMMQIQVVLDQKIFDDSDEEWSAIRAFHENSGSVPTADVRDIHYNSQFTLRAGRRAWSETI